MKLNGIIVAVVLAITFGSLSATAKASDYKEIGRKAANKFERCTDGFKSAGGAYKNAQAICWDIVARDLSLKVACETISRGSSKLNIECSLIRDGEIE